MEVGCLKFNSLTNLAMQKNKKFFLGLIMFLTVPLLAGCYHNQSSTLTPTMKILPDTTDTAKNPLATSSIMVMIPKDMRRYSLILAENSSDEGQKIIKTWPFLKQTVTVPYTSNTLQTAAEYAVQGLTQQAEVQVTYLKIIDKTAYLLTNIHQNGWAGVSFTIGVMEPIIEKTLLLYPEVNKVIFSLAPGDK